MKKLWGGGLGSTLTNAASAVTAGAAKLASSSQAAEKGPFPSSPTPSQDKQYLRLPLDSARKLRWFDKCDLEALVKAHTRETQELYETIEALKRIARECGVLDRDGEVKYLVVNAAQRQEAQEGVNAVLLLAAQFEIEQLRSTGQRQQEEILKLNSILKQKEEEHNRLTLWLLDEPRSNTGRGMVDEITVQRLLEALTVLGEADHWFKGLAAKVDSMQVEMLTSISQEDSVRHQGIEAGEVGPKSHSCSSSHMRELTQELTLRCSPAEPTIQQLTVEKVCGQHTNAQMEAALKLLQEELMGSRTALTAAEQKATRPVDERGQAVSLQASAELVCKYQDICLQYKERTEIAEKRCSLLEARISKLEGLLKESQEEALSIQGQLTCLREQGESVRRQAVEKEQELNMLKKEVEQKGQEGPTIETLHGQVKSLEQQLIQCRSTFNQMVSQLSEREATEARLKCEMEGLQSAAAERDSLRAQLAAMKETLEGHRADLSQVEHYKKVAREMECVSSRVQEELLATAQLVTRTETKYLEAQKAALDARLVAEQAEARRLTAESRVEEEVERRVAAISTTRSLWPQAIGEEVERLEVHSKELQNSLATLQVNLRAEKQRCEQESSGKARLQQQLVELRDRLASTERLMEAKVQELEVSLETSQHQADLLKERLEKREVELSHCSSKHMIPREMNCGPGEQPLWRGLSSSGSMDSLGSKASERSKWPVQYQGGSPSLGVGRKGDRRERYCEDSLGPCNLQGVDLVYLKNVLLKFLDAVLAGRVAERDALLPAVAALLEASPAEFNAMRQVMNSTAPVGAQMWSFLGIKS